MINDDWVDNFFLCGVCNEPFVYYGHPYMHKRPLNLVQSFLKLKLNVHFMLKLKIWKIRNLYSSIPIHEGINEVKVFAEKHWDKIDNLGFNVNDLIEFLKFVSYNYEISYHQQTYLQVKGCPMGTHFSPPFAIIFMNSIERKA